MYAVLSTIYSLIYLTFDGKFINVSPAPLSKFL